MSNYINSQSIEIEKDKKNKNFYHITQNPPLGGRGLHLENPHFKISYMRIVIGSSYSFRNMLRVSAGSIMASTHNLAAA